MCFSCQGQIIVFIFTHLDSRGLETLLNSRHMNLPPGFSTRKASSRAWAGDTHMMDYYYDIIILMDNILSILHKTLNSFC